MSHLKQLLGDIDDFLLEFTEDHFDPHYWEAASLRERIKRLDYEEIMKEMGESADERGPSKELNELIQNITKSQSPSEKAKLERELVDQLEKNL